jgi:hypothetical protein
MESNEARSETKKGKVALGWNAAVGHLGKVNVAHGPACAVWEISRSTDAMIGNDRK